MKVAIDKLTPDKRNARRHPPASIAALEESLRRFGQRRPVVAQRQGKRLVIRSGHGIVEAARKLGWQEVEVLEVDDDDAKATMWALADNRTAELSEWDDEVLKGLLAEVDDTDWLAFNDFTDPDAESAPRADSEPKIDRAAELNENWRVELGDLWRIGDHRLLCGDSTKAEDVAKLMAGEKAQLCWTDPPWNVAYGEQNHPSWRPRTIANDNLGELFPEFCSGFCKNIALATVPGALVYLAMSAQEWPTIHKELTAAGFHWSSTIIWAKDSLVLSRKDYHTQYEPIWYGWNEAAARLYPLADRTQSDLWEIPRPKKSEEHPTMKPVELVEKAIRNSSRPGDLVLDLFLGSGTTLIASGNLHRRCFGMELSPEFCAVILQRTFEVFGIRGERM